MEKLNAGHVGEIVYWSLSGRFIDDNLLSLSYPAGLASEKIIPTFTKRKAFTKAIKEFFGDRPNDYMCKLTERKLSRNCYGVSQLSTVDDGINGDAAGIIVYDEKTDNLVGSKHTICQEAVDAIRPRLDMRPIDDLRQIILRLARSWHGVSLRSSGGIYFIPDVDDNLAQVGLLETLIKTVAPGSYLYRIPQADFGGSKGEHLRTAVKTSVVEDALSELEAIMDHAEDMKGSVARTSTRVEKTLEVIKKLGVYEDVLGIKLDAVRAEATAARNVLQEMVAAAA